MEIKNVKVELPTPEEQKDGAEVTFTGTYGRKNVRILACHENGKWYQWGENDKILSANVWNINRWCDALTEIETEGEGVDEDV